MSDSASKPSDDVTAVSQPECRSLIMPASFFDAASCDTGTAGPSRAVHQGSDTCPGPSIAAPDVQALLSDADSPSPWSLRQHLTPVAGLAYILHV